VDVRVGAGEPLRFISTHLDQGRDSDSRAAQARFLAEQLGAADDRPAILAGDFNSTPDAPILSVIRTTWTELFMQPMPVGPEGLPRRRVDHVLGRPASGWLTLDSGFIEDRVASDHRPVFVTLEWTGR
jgi:endonuclease/exonuclease/phosphatase family metal-dependent hydrolase